MRSPHHVIDSLISQPRNRFGSFFDRTKNRAPRRGARFEILGAAFARLLLCGDLARATALFAVLAVFGGRDTAAVGAGGTVFGRFGAAGGLFRFTREGESGGKHRGDEEREEDF